MIETKQRAAPESGWPRFIVAAYGPPALSSIGYGAVTPLVALAFTRSPAAVVACAVVLGLGNGIGEVAPYDATGTDGEGGDERGGTIVTRVDNLIWIDCEMTGLDLLSDALIEVAVLVTDKDLTVLGDGLDIIVKPPAEALAHMSAFVTEMHTKSGLLGELDAGMTLGEAEKVILAYVKTYVQEAGKAPLCGNTIGTDRAFLRRDMPELDAHLHYRNVDVSSIKELARRWFPRVVYCAPEKHGGHRALADIQESVNELRYYRDALFIPQPGPSRAELRKIAERYGGVPGDGSPESPAEGGDVAGS